ncbi:uncharacterized protein LOC130629012 [Hydractinia symbiolongicarpus]|uniref:uncharacterized protein LOC130629012 n=1 Tax=Hydractinia symbiolongicarpus TaxID=13093 RepID=UPI00254ABCB5|nr:uncharacterized protein LOC130629012 [Hydractinia symbiolongicarpus]
MSFLATLMVSSYRVALAYWDKNRSTTNAKIGKRIWSTLQITGEGMMFLTAGLLQLYLLYHIKQKVRAMKGSRHSATNHGSRVTKSIQLLFVCLVVCYAPHTATYIMREFGLILYKDQVCEKDRIAIGESLETLVVTTSSHMTSK